MLISQPINYRKTNEMKNYVIAILLIFGLIHIAAADDIPKADAVPFIGIEEASKELKKAVVAVQVLGNNEKQRESLGTGFLVKGDRDVILVVTCKHIVLAAEKDNKPIFVGLDTEKGYQRFPSHVAYIDPVQDIAILAPQKNTKEDVKLQLLTFDKETFDDGSSLIEGRGVIVPGYPLALGIEDDQNHPVIRHGIIAQFTGKDYFLLDGIVSHGNSGSPVFSIKYNTNKLIGMVTSFQNDSISLYDEHGEVVALLPYNSGLARGVTMGAILSALKKAKY
jgi:Trypsin-like peptidase domain